MEKEFVTYDLALSLKALGYNEHCFAIFDCDTHKLIQNILCQVDGCTNEALGTVSDVVWITAPTWQAAFNWFEENYKMHAIPKPIIGSKNGYDSFPILGWDYDIITLNVGATNSYYMGYPITEWFTATLDRFEDGDTLSDLGIEPMTKEEAQQACLEKLCEIVEKQKEHEVN